ncbi:MAG: hypothetical protein GF317_15630 [Candidatus Lokiarchaeota archaeon]|nr:hypothetical protein [Candidatus Lokiarchaeota archaeon]MBD3200994.1 hypothetical protein [Candidatus Lokiarchaeota archaeon]
MSIGNLIVSDSILNKWQRLIDALANLMEVPSAFVMKHEYPYLKAVVSSKSPNNPIPLNYEEEIFGKYCEETINGKKMHVVPNALKDKRYRNKPGLEENKLITYLGFPLEWPTGDVFGTICVADFEERHFTKDQKALMREMKLAVDAHLELIFKNEKLRKAQQKIKDQRDNLKLLTTTVRHEIANNLSFIYGFLQVKQKKAEISDKICNKLMPHVTSIIESIDHIEKLEEIFTKEKQFEKIDPNPILVKIKKEYPNKITIRGSCTVLADDYINFVLKELIRNAFKHSDTEKIEVSLEETEEKSIIAVQDYGKGLPPDTVRSHFQNRKNQRKLKGLTIIEKIMDRYGGSIKYEKNDKGALISLIWNKKQKTLKTL